MLGLPKRSNNDRSAPPLKSGTGERNSTRKLMIEYAPCQISRRHRRGGIGAGTRFSEQLLRVGKWSPAGVRLPRGAAAGNKHDRMWQAIPTQAAEANGRSEGNSMLDIVMATGLRYPRPPLATWPCSVALLQACFRPFALLSM